MSALDKEGINKIGLVAFEKNEIGRNGFWKHIGFAVRNDLVYRNKNIYIEKLGENIWVSWNLHFSVVWDFFSKRCWTVQMNPLKKEKERREKKKKEKGQSAVLVMVFLWMSSAIL